MGGPIDVILPLCPVTELPRVLCDHCDSFTMQQVERDYVAGLYGVNSVPGPPDPTDPLGVDYQSRSWHAPQPTAITCDHGKPDGAVLCPACEERLRRTLADLPNLIDDLEDALVKRTTFLQQGTPTEADPEEASLPFNLAASRALADITRRLDGPPSRVARDLLSDWRGTMRRPDLPALAHAVTAFAASVHNIIDRPETPAYYGVCPACGKDIYQERITAAEELVACRCGYRARLSAHQAAQLDLGEDRWMTLTEVVKTLCDGGEPTTRQEVESFIYKGGPLGVLQRRLENRPRWSGGRLVPHEVYCYRLGDVRTMLLARRLQRMHATTRQR